MGEDGGDGGRGARKASGVALGEGVDTSGGAGVGGKRGKGGGAMLVDCQGGSAGRMGERGGLCDVGRDTGGGREAQRQRQRHCCIGRGTGTGTGWVRVRCVGRLVNDQGHPIRPESIWGRT